MPVTKEEALRRGISLHDIKHNQHRRAEWQDYGGCGLYMVTFCIEGRQALFGRLEGNISAKRGTADFPHIVLSPLGRAIREEELPKIHHFYPQIEMWQAAIMPDHLHLLLYVARPLPDGKKLGDILRRFKGGCTRAWWAQGGRTAQEERTALESAGTIAAGTTAAGTTAAGTTAAGTTTVGTIAAGTIAAGTTTVGTIAAGTTAAGTTAAGTTAGNDKAVVPVLSSTVHRPSLFEAGYHDRIIKRPGMLDIIKRYMSDNPLRALMRRQLPHLMERRLHLRVGAHDYAAFGALFLLKRAEKEQVFYHRRDKVTGIPTEQTDDYKRERKRQLAEAREGVVLVSPAISKGERLVINAAIEEGLPVIHLQKEPIERYWKPERRRFEACARGALLILSPWGLDEELKRTAQGGRTAQGRTALESAGTMAVGTMAGGNMAACTTDYNRFHRLNDMAAEICATTDAVLLDITDII